VLRLEKNHSSLYPHCAQPTAFSGGKEGPRVCNRVAEPHYLLRQCRRIATLSLSHEHCGVRVGRRSGLILVRPMDSSVKVIAGTGRWGACRKVRPSAWGAARRK